MNDQNNQNEEHLKIEVFSEVTDSGDDHHYADNQGPVGETAKEQTALSVIGLILAFPFPILISILWITISDIKEKQSLGEDTMNAVFLYLLQFFLVPLLTLTSVIIAFIVTLKSKQIAKKIGYISMGVTGLGIIILGLFLNHT